MPGVRAGVLVLPPPDEAVVPDPLHPHIENVDAIANRNISPVQRLLCCAAKGPFGREVLNVTIFSPNKT